MKTELIKLEDLDITSQVVLAADEGDILEFTEANGLGRSLALQMVEYGDFNFERKSDWMRFINKLNRHNDTPIKRLITGNEKSSNWESFVISRETIEYHEDGFLIEFKNPVKLLLERIGDKAVVIEVKKLKGKTTWEWYHRNTEKHNELGNYAGICEIFIQDVEIVE